MKTIQFFILMMLMCLSVVLMQPVYAQRNNSNSDIFGTYIGRQLGRVGSRVVTLILQPDGKASMAIAPTPGANAQVSSGTWKLVTSSSLRVDVIGVEGHRTFYYNRFGDRLNEVESPFEIRGSIPMTLVKQPQISGTYTAIRSGANVLQTLSLCLQPNGTAALIILQTSPRMEPVTYTGTWMQMPTGDVQVTLTTPGPVSKFTFSRTAGNVWTTSEWDRAVWGPGALTFAGEK